MPRMGTSREECVAKTTALVEVEEDSGGRLVGIGPQFGAHWMHPNTPETVFSL
jgi:hypothetical protein